MRLAATQRQFAAALMRPQRATKAAAALIRPNLRLTAEERLDIYRQSYWSRLIDSLREDFPGLEGIFGKEEFERVARAYLAECPSRSFTLRDLGSRFPDWLRERRHSALAQDMARLEWAHIVAFDGPTGDVLTPEYIARRGKRRIGLQPCITLLRLRFSVDEMRVNAAAARRKNIFLAVHRIDNSVYYRRLAKEEWQVLSALRDGLGIQAAIELTSAKPTRIEKWFTLWTELGWLTKH